VPWTITNATDERVRFVIEVQRGARTMTAVCAAFGITRETGYKWLGRYAAGGFDALSDVSRARLSQSSAISADISEKLLILRKKRPQWGPKKLRAALMREWPLLTWPAASTIGDLLQRNGLIETRHVRVPALPQTRPFAEATEPNDLWCIDFKGWFRTRDGQRCDPLTVSDATSRFLLTCAIVAPTTEGVWPACERLFVEHGQPRGLRMDNGSPFGSKGAAGLTRLSVRWVKLGIVLEPITPGCPQQNGRHERMHRTLKQETSTPPAASPAEQQQRFDRFRHEFNDIRPHEALGQQTPASVHRPNLRRYSGRLDDPWYDAEHTVHRVLGKGEIRWGDAMLYISEALAGELIGIAELPSGDRVARFADLDLGVIARGSDKFRRFSAPRPGRAEPEQSRNTVNHVPGPKCQ
jgi:transposase InsO family protein